MTQPPIRFTDGAAYERGMGVWSRTAGGVFLDWLAPPLGLRWLDVGCGNGAFTELAAERCAPRELHGIDPSDAQLAFARGRPGLAGAALSEGDAMALPYDADRFDIATLALVIVFVPDPKRAVAEMRRVVRPGGTVAAYMWDIMHPGGFPFNPVGEELRNAGSPAQRPPSVEASRADALQGLWSEMGFRAVETRAITVERIFSSFDEFWTVTTGAGLLKRALAELPAAVAQQVKDRVHARLTKDAQGRIIHSARANAVKGIVPG